LNIGISFLNPCPFTKYLPFLAVVSAVLTFRFKTLGLSSSYIAFFLFILIFFSDLPCEGQLWQMSLLFILALNIFILLLSIEEAEACLKEMGSQTQEMKRLSHRVEIEYQLAKKTAEEKEEELKEEIERLKQEAELRRIEKASDLKQLELVQSEIELLTSQKEGFIEDSRKARMAAVHQLQQFKESEAILKRDLIASQETILALQQRPPVVQNVSVEDTDTDLKKALAVAEGVSTQLRSQFEEKSQILSQTRKELFQTQGKLIALEKELAFSKLDPDREEVGSLEKEVAALTLEMDALEGEINQLEELVSRILFQ
jgi:hypothetical protein